MARGRTFSREFTLAVVRDVVSGAQRPAQACREHQLSEGLLLRWRKEVAARGEEAFTPAAADSATALDRRVAALERFCGQLALENAALTKGLSALPLRNGTR